MSLDPASKVALRQPVFTIFGAIEIELALSVVRLVDGAGEVTFDGKTFTGRDPFYGTLESVAELSDGVDTLTPTTNVTLLPPSNAAAADLANPSNQSAQVSAWVGVLDARTGQVIGEPDLKFIGVVDVPTLVVGQNSRKLKLDLSSFWELLAADQEGVRLNDAWHQLIHPGETGLKGVTGVSRPDYWGMDAPAAITTPNFPKPNASSPYGYLGS